jgi:teichuronic acid exporter
MNLRDKASGAVLWSLIDRITQQGFQMLVSILIARILMPSEIGLIGMIWVFVSIVSIFCDAGFSPTLQQKLDATELDECSVFYFNLFFSAGGVLVLWIAAPTIARFYALPELEALVRAVSFMFVFTAPGLIHTVVLNKKLDLRTQAKAGMISALASGLVAISMAYTGFGVWSLVGQILTQSLVRSVALWAYSLWRPKLIFSFASLRGMFPFGSRVLSSAFLNAIFDNSYPVVIGKMYSPETLGYFTMSMRIPQTFSSSLTSIVSRVSTPLYPSLREKPEAFRNALRKALTMMTMVNSPVMVGLAIVATPLVTILLTPKWLPVVPYLQLYCVIMLFSPFKQANLDAALGLGNAGLHFRLGLFHKSLSFANVLIAYRWGIMGLLTGELVVTLITCAAQAYLIGRQAGYPLLAQLRDLMPSLMASLTMAGSVALVQFIHWPSALVDLIFQIGVGLATYVGFCWFFRLQAFEDLRKLLMHLIYRKSTNLV